MSRPGTLALLASLLAAGSAWPQGTPLGPEFRVNTYTSGWQYRASVASDASGNFIVVWDSDFPAPPPEFSSKEVFGQRYDSSGTPLGGEIRVNTYTTGDQVSPVVASDASGNFVVVWQSSLQDGVFGQRFASSGAPLGPEFRVNTYTTGDQSRASVASDASGNFVVVWQSSLQDGSSYGVFGQRFASSGAPLGLEFRVNTFTTGYQIVPHVASDSSGNFVVVWTSQNGGPDFDVIGRRYDSSGAPLGPEFRVNTYTTDTQELPSVAADSVGNFVVVWDSRGQDSGFAGVFGQRYASSGAPLGPEFRVNTFTAYNEWAQSVASDPAGDFVVVWAGDGQDGSGSGVFGQRYASSGVPVGPEFRVNTYTTYNQSGPSVASDSAGNFVVVWASAYQDGWALGVFGQRYSEIVPVDLMRFGVE